MWEAIKLGACPQTFVVTLTTFTKSAFYCVFFPLNYAPFGLKLLKLVGNHDHDDMRLAKKAMTSF